MHWNLPLVLLLWINSKKQPTLRLTPLDFKELNYLTAKSGLGDIRFFENPKSLALYMGYILSPPQYIYLISLIFGSMDAYNRGVSQGTAL